MIKNKAKAEETTRESSWVKLYIQGGDRSATVVSGKTIASETLALFLMYVLLIPTHFLDV